LSGGRVELGIGIAVTEDEFDNLGVDFKSRGRRCNDALAALKALWTQETPTHDGEFYSYAGLKFSPKPKQLPHPPILVGGGSQAALRRTARFGNGWHALRQTPNQIRASLGTLERMTEEQGRDPAQLHISISIPIAFDASPSRHAPEGQTSLKGKAPDLAATISAYRDAGVHEMVISLGNNDKSAHAEMLERVNQEVRPLITT